MDPITVATTVVTFVSFVQDMKDLAQKVKESIEKVSDNRKKLRALCASSVKHLVELEEVTRAHSNDIVLSQQLQDALTELRDELERIYSRCSTRLGVKKHGFAFVWSRIKAWKVADELENEMLVFESNIRACEMRFLTVSIVRFEQSVHAQTHVLHAIGDEQRTAFDQMGHAIRGGIPQAQQELPYEVILRQTSADLYAHKGIVAKPSLSSNLTLAEKTEAASRSIDMHLELLKEIFTRPTTFASLKKDHGNVEPYKYSQFAYGIEDPSRQTHDALVEISWILKMFRSPHLHVTAADCAMHLHSIAVTLGDLGMFTEALMILAWAVTLYRDLHRDGGDRFAAYLARSLRFTGLFRLRLDQCSAALVATTEAAALFRQAYACVADDGIAADLAKCLNVRSQALRKLGQLHDEEARCSMDEAVSIVRRVACGNDEFKVDLAMVLIAQSRQLGDETCYETALDCGREAIELLSHTDSKDRSPYTQDRACALFVHGYNLYRAGHSVECTEINEQAIALYRMFFAARPRVWRLEFCDALNNQGWYFYSIGRHDDALRLSQEALDLLRGVVTTAKECSVFANVLETPAVAYEAMGCHEDALHAVEEIVRTIYNYPAFQRRNVRLAEALRWAARLLRALDRNQEALLKEDEANLLEAEPDLRV